MTAGTIGPVAVWAAMVLATVAVITGRRRWLVGSAATSVFAVLVLAVALIGGDFSLEYVATTTSLATPWPYRLAALWGGMDGSMLFYTSLTVVVAAVGLRSVIGVRVGAAVGLGLAAITVFFANPFVVLDLPAIDGDGLLAILQHPAMIYHPPLLYLGLVTLVVPFARTVEVALGAVDRPTWMAVTRRWLYLSWTLLTVGMAAGANWAYVELGWGGFWAWDPVENTALMPWLATTVFLHSSRLEESRSCMRRWNVLLAALPFALSVLGVYLTRSGVTGSIHSFAEDPVVGRILLIAAAVVTVVALILAIRSEPGQPWGPLRLDRSAWLGLNSILITAALVFVTAGSAYPAFASVFFGESVAVDSRFFAATVFPVALLVALSLALSMRRRGVTDYVVVFAVSAVVVAVLSGVELGTALLAAALASLVLLVWWLSRLRPDGRLLTAYLAHMGMAVVLVGVAGSTFGTDFNGSMMEGDSVTIGGHVVTLNELSTGESDRFVYVRATVDVDGEKLTPEIRAYEDQTVPVAEPASSTTPIDDVIVAISLLFPDEETVAVSVFVRPLVWWVWVGAALIGLAGLVALFSKDGAAAGQRRPATGGQRPAGTTTDSASRLPPR